MKKSTPQKSKYQKSKHQKSKHHKALPIHIACVTGNKAALKRIVSTLPRRALEIKDCLGRTPLILTVSKNFIDCCTVLLKAGATVDNTDHAGQTALHIAAGNGFHPFVKLLLSYKASWIQRDYSGATALHMAAINPNVKGLSILMKHVKPAEIDIQDSTLKTALHWSAAYCCNNNIKLLLAQGANPCIPDEGGQTPLHWAAANSDLEALACAKTLQKNKQSLINWQDYQGKAPLHIAVSCGSEEVVYFLASREHCNIDIMDNYFLTPLHYAAKRGISEKADILLKKRASHLCIDDNGAMPLHYAAHNNHAKAVEAFTNKSYICDEPDHLGRSALMWAAIKNSEAALKILASAYATSSYTDKNGFTALHAAAICGNASAIELLVNAGLYVDAKDKNGMTPFLKACEFGRSKSAQKLLSLGANMEEKDINCSSALHWCANGGHAYLSTILIKLGADYNATDNFGMTPLHHVSSFGDFVNCTCVLVESGADRNISDIEGKTALHSAVLNEQYGIVGYLCEHGWDVNAMFLMDYEWFTTYDCAIFRCDARIALFLEKNGGIKAQAIKNYASKLIQSWYRRKKRRVHSNKFAYSSVDKKPCSTLCSRQMNKNFKSVSVCQICSLVDMKKQNLVFICNECFHKYASHLVNEDDCQILDKKSADCHSDSNASFSASIPGYKLLTFCNNPRTCSGLIQLDNVDYKKAFFHVAFVETDIKAPLCYIFRDTAARIIQKAWKKYKTKKSFSNVRNEVRLSYINHSERSAAEKNWHLRLQEFLEHMF